MEQSGYSLNESYSQQELKLFSLNMNYKELISQETFEPITNAVFLPICYRNIQKSVDLLDNNKLIAEELMKGQYSVNYDLKNILLISNSKRSFSVSACCLRIVLALLERQRMLKEMDMPEEYRETIRLTLHDLSIVSLYFKRVAEYLKTDGSVNEDQIAVDSVQLIIDMITRLEIEPSAFEIFDESSNKLVNQLIQHALNCFIRTTEGMLRRYTTSLSNFNFDLANYEEQILYLKPEDNATLLDPLCDLLNQGYRWSQEFFTNDPNLQK